MTNSSTAHFPKNRPPQATHCVPGDGVHPALWLFRDDLNWHYCLDQKPFNWVNSGSDEPTNPVPLSGVDFAPQNDESQNVAPIEWDGEGLPPAGTACEFQHHNAPNGVWYPTTIRFSSHAHVIYVDSIVNCEACFAVSDSCKIDFRPIRTPEQIAEEERRTFIDHVINDSMGRCDIPGAAYLYEAGYRKQVD